MKKTLKKLLLLLTVCIMIFTAVPVSAETIVPPSVTLYDQIHAQPNRALIGAISTKKETAKITFTKKGIGKIQTIKDPIHTYFYFVPQKAGKTTVTIKSQYNTIKQTFTVLKYQNPISSIKIGKTQIAGSKFDKEDVLKLSYSKYAKAKNKISIKPKKGWDVNISLVDKNGTYIFGTFIQNNGTFTVTSEYKTKGYHLQIAFQNQKNYHTVCTEIYFK